MARMFIRCHRRFKNGKHHTYYSVVENRRCANGQIMQREVLYLGELSSTQQAAWLELLAKVSSANQTPIAPSLFATPKSSDADVIPFRLGVNLDQMGLHHPRSFGDCWLGCQIWNELGMEEFWRTRLDGNQRSEVEWHKVLEVLVVNRLVAPGSEFAVHRHWFGQSAMNALIDVDDQVAGKDRLYRCLDRLLVHREDLFGHLTRRWKDLFNASYDVLLYDLTSTYFEGLCEQIPKAVHGYSRDGRPDCRQVVIALVVTPEGLPLAYEVMPGNTSDRSTLNDFLSKIERLYGKARRTWVMDRGIPTEETLATMRDRQIDYVVGTPRGRLSGVHRRLLDVPWKDVHKGVQVKLLSEQGEVLILAKSDGRQAKERAMRRNRLRRFSQGLRALRKRLPERDKLLERIGALRQQAGRVAHLVEVHVPKPQEPVTPETFHYHLRIQKFKALEALDGHYLLRSSLTSESPQRLWECYTQLVHVEAAFKSLKSDLHVRPIHHHLERRMEAHIFIAFMAYALTSTLNQKLNVHAPGLTSRAVLEKLAGIKLIDVHIPLTDGRTLVLSRYTVPEPDQQLILDKLQWTLPTQPPPKIYANQLPPPKAGADAVADPQNQLPV